MKRTLSCLALTSVLGVQAFAQITLTDGNSSAQIDPAVGNGAGMYNWTVDGINHLALQWFWYRIGPGGGEQSIDAIGGLTTNLVGTNVAQISYQNNLIKVETVYILTGGANGSSQSDILESIRVTNVSATGFDVHFFQYTDFDMNGTTGGDTVVRTNANTFRQSDGVFGASETISTPVADHWEGNIFPATLISLTDGNPTTLSDSGTGLTGDCTFAWQWDRFLTPGQSFLISKDKQIVPEPSTFVAMGIGLAALLAARRRR